MTDAEVGKYLRYLIHQWEKGSIPSDPVMIQTIRFNQDLWTTLEPKFPLCNDGRRRNPRLEIIRANLEAYTKKRSEAGKIGAGVRWDSKRNAIANADDSSKQDGKPIASTSTSISTPSSHPNPKENKKEPPKAYLDLARNFLEKQREAFPQLSAWKQFEKRVLEGGKNLELFNTQNGWDESKISETLNFILNDTGNGSWDGWSGVIQTLGNIRAKKGSDLMKFEKARNSMNSGETVLSKVFGSGNES